MLKHPGSHAPLDVLTDGPVLAIHPVPEIDRIGGVEVRALELGRMKQKIAHDSGVTRIAGPDSVCGYVIGGEADQEVRVDQLSLVAHPLIVVEAFERTAIAGAGLGEGPGAVTMRNSPVPVELRSASLLERRHQAAQL